MITVYAGTVPLGDLDLAPAAGVFEIRTKPKEVATGTRGVKVVAKGDGDGRPAAAEFAEAEVVVRTGE